MITKTFSTATIGIVPKIIDIEVDLISQHMPNFVIVGLPDKAVQESKERIYSAITSSGFVFPRKKIVINLAPADIPKVGTNFDLAIALALLTHDGQIPDAKILSQSAFLGELSLNGQVKPVNGTLSSLIFANTFNDKNKQQIKSFFIPYSSRKLVSYKPKINIYPIKSLLQAILYLKGENTLEPIKLPINSKQKQLTDSSALSTLSQISGNEEGKRALQISCSGRHNILFYGSPGTGKTLLAKSSLAYLPKLPTFRSMQTSQIYESYYGKLTKLIHEPPFRSPHHSITEVALIGGGSIPKPGEVALAHNGILFLDELPEFQRKILDSLRQPIEDKKVQISRLKHHYEFPCDFLLIATMNPCKCGYYGDEERECKCTFAEIKDYQSKISGPILDRFDILVNIPRTEEQNILKVNKKVYEEIKITRNKIKKARLIQRQRFKQTSLKYNSQMGKQEIINYCMLEEKSKKVMRQAYDKLQLSIRSYLKVIKVARTIADLEDIKTVKEEHILEALQYRLENTSWGE